MENDLPYRAEYAKSNRAKCITCNSLISKDNLRMAFMVQSRRFDGKQANWNHYDCFFSKFHPKSVAEIDHFEALKYKDQTRIAKSISDNLMEDGLVAGIAKKGEESSLPSKKIKIDEEEALKKQSDLLYDYIKKFENMKRDEIRLLFEHNNLYIPSDNQAKYERLSDSFVFGMAKCSQCKRLMVYKQGSYVCKGNSTERARCEFKTEKPNRVPIKLPRKIVDEYEFLQIYKYKPRERIYDSRFKEAVEINNQTKTEEEKKEKPNPKIPLLFEGYKFIIVGGCDKYIRNEIKEKIQSFGGEIVAAKDLDRTVLCVIIKNDELKKENTEINELIKKAENLDVHILSDKFLDEIKDGVNTVEVMKANVISSWGEDFEKKFRDLNVKEIVKFLKSRNSLELYSQLSDPLGVQKVKVEEGIAVDLDSEKDHIAHVFKEGDDVYSHDVNPKKFWVFRSWGRIATTIGGNKIEDFNSKDEAKQLFTSLYKGKTGNFWKDRKNFVKHPNMYYPVNVDYGSFDEEETKNTSIRLQSENSKLSKSVQDLI